jgi:hypothetical protein
MDSRQSTLKAVNQELTECEKIGFFQLRMKVKNTFFSLFYKEKKVKRKKKETSNTRVERFVDTLALKMIYIRMKEKCILLFFKNKRKKSIFRLKTNISQTFSYQLDNTNKLNGLSIIPKLFEQTLE